VGGKATCFPGGKTGSIENFRRDPRGEGRDRANKTPGQITGREKSREVPHKMGGQVSRKQKAPITGDGMGGKPKSSQSERGTKSDKKQKKGNAPKKGGVSDKQRYRGPVYRKFEGEGC